MKMKLPLLILFLFVVCVQPLMAGHVLTNSDILDLTKAKIPDNLIVDEIHRQKCDFSTAPKDLIELKKDGVDDVVLGAMINAGKAAPAARAPAPTVASKPPSLDIGVYYLKGGKWKNLPPEIVNWKTGGVLKSLGTMGIVKGDVNGNIHGKESPTSVTEPVQFLFVVPEGDYITEYQLIRLHEHHNRRDFRTVTGGVFHASGGVTRDVVRFSSKRLGERTFKVTLNHLKAGEYGFLPPGNNASRQAMSSLGAMYTFHIVE